MWKVIILSFCLVGFTACQKNSNPSSAINTPSTLAPPTTNSAPGDEPPIVNTASGFVRLPPAAFAAEAAANPVNIVYSGISN